MLLTLVFWIANRCNGKIEVKSKSKGKIKGSGQECPLHTNRNGLPPPKTAKENSNLAPRSGYSADHRYAHVCSIFGGLCKVCITTQYCSVFACNALSCSFVACGARTSKMTLML